MLKILLPISILSFFLFFCTSLIYKHQLVFYTHFANSQPANLRNMVQDKKNIKIAQTKNIKTFKKKIRKGRRVPKKVFSRSREEIMLEVMEIIDHLHRRVALERGVGALRSVQNEAWKIAWKRWMMMKFCGVS